MRKISAHFATLSTVLLIAGCFGQSGPLPAQPTVEELVKALGKEDSARGAAGNLANSYGGDPRTLPALKLAFSSSLAKDSKQSVALSLLRLHEKDQIYFDYLSSFAKEAVDCDAPAMSDSRGINPAFEIWSQTHKLSLADAAKEMQDHILDVFLLVPARDERSAPIFRKGLRSNILEIVYLSIDGLGGLGTPEDIEEIIEAAERTLEFGRLAAKVLILYKTPRDRDFIAARIRGSQLNDLYVQALKSAALQDKGPQGAK